MPKYFAEITRTIKYVTTLDVEAPTQNDAYDKVYKMLVHDQVSFDMSYPEREADDVQIMLEYTYGEKDAEQD